MVKKAAILIILLILILAQTSIAAIISGTIYNWELNKEENVIIEVNTTPRQTIVTGTGEYLLTLIPGSYAIKAKTTDGTETIETIEIIDDGVYNLDIIVLPIEPEDILDETNIEQDKEKTSVIAYLIAGISALVLVLIIIFIFRIKRKEKEIKKEVKDLKEVIKHKEVDKELLKIIEAIKTAGGRTTQKELRKQFPSSEAKISLMITELEKKEIIQKIKKGRGNVIVLK